MSFDVNWDIDKYKEEHESDDHWELRRNFMSCWKQSYPEERLVCLARVFSNIEFMGCRYPQEVMQEVARMSKEVNTNLTYNYYGAKLPNSFDIRQSLAQNSVNAESLLRKSADETVQGLLSNSKPVDSFHIGSSNQGFVEVGSCSNEVMREPLAISEVLRTPYNNSYENMSNQNCGTDNSTGIGEPENLQQQSCFSGFIQKAGSSAVVEDCYQINNDVSKPLLRQHRDPRIKLSAGLQKETEISQQNIIQPTNWQAHYPRIQVSAGLQKETEISQQNIIQPTNWQAHDPRIQFSAGLQKKTGISQQDEIMMNQQTDQGIVLTESRQHAPIPHPTIVNASSHISMTFGLQNSDKYTLEPNKQQDPPVLGSKNTTSCSEQITLPHQKACSNTSEKRYAGAIQNCNKAINRSNKKQKRKSKGKFVVGDQILKGLPAKRYAYWLHAGKTSEEAEYLCHIQLKNIPEYNLIKEKLGNLCQLKRMKGNNIIPAFKKRGKQSKNVKVATKAVTKPCVIEPEHCVTNNCETTYKDTIIDRHYKFWKIIGKSEDEARILSKLPLDSIPLAMELKAKAKTAGHSKKWMKWTEAQFLNPLLEFKKKPEAITINVTQPQDIANDPTSEDSDIEMITKEPETIVISDDDVNHNIRPTVTHKDSTKITVSKQTQMNRFNWWISHGKSEEEATVLSQKPMAISDALNNISGYQKIIDKKLQEKKQVFNARQTQSKDDTTPVEMNISDASDESSEHTEMIDKVQCEKWLAFQAMENQRIKNNTFVTTHQENPIITNVNLQSINSTAENSGMPESDKNAPTTNEKDQLKIYIKDANSKIGYKESLKVRDAIAKCISDNKKINMPSCGILYGCFVVICTDEQSRDWLDKQIPTLEPWKGAQLDIVDKMVTKHAQLFIPTVPESEIQIYTKNNDILKKLLEQNPTIGCNKWVVIDTQTHKGGRLLAVRFDKNAHNLLKSVSYKLKWYGRPIKIKLKRNNKMKNPDNNKLFIIDPPNYEIYKSASLITNKDVSTVIPKTEDWAVESLHNIDETTVPMAPRSIIGNEGTKQGGPSNSLPVTQGNNEDASNHVNVNTPQLKNLAQPSTPTERAGQSTRHISSTMTTESIQRKVGISGGYWGIDTPRLLSGHKAAITLKTNLQDYSNLTVRDDAGRREYCYREVRPFSERDDEYSLEERVAARRINYSLDSLFVRQTCYRPNSVLAERVQEYSPEKRVFDEQERTGPWEDRVIQDYPQENRVLARQSQEYSWENRVLAKQSPEYLKEGRLDEQGAVCSREDRVLDGRRQEYSWQVFDEHEGKTFWEDRVIQDSHGEKLVLNRQNQEYSDDIVLAGGSQKHSRENIFSRRSPEYSSEGRFNERDVEYSRSNRVFDGRRHEYSRKVFDEHKDKRLWEDRVIQDFNRDERVLDRQNEQNSNEDRVLAGRSHEYSGENIFSRRSAENSGESRFDERDTSPSLNLEYSIEYSRSDRIFDGPHLGYSRKIFEEHEGERSWKDKVIQDSPREEQVLAGQSEDYAKGANNHSVIGQSQEILRDNKFSDRGSPEYSGKDRFNARNAEYSRNHTVFDGLRHEYSREIFDNNERESSTKDRVIQDSPREKRGLVGPSQEYSRDGRYFYRRCSEYSGRGRFDERNPVYSRNDRGFNERDQEQRQERDLAGQYQGSSREDSVVDKRDQYFRVHNNLNERDLYPGNDETFNERVDYSREHRDAGRNQEYSSNYQINQLRGNPKTWDNPASNRSPFHTLNDMSKRSRYRSTGKGAEELQLTYQNTPFTVKRQRSKRAKKH